VLGVLGADQLAKLYGLTIEEPNLLVLMRHRAFLFGLLGGIFTLSAFRPMYQPLGFVAGFASVLSFLFLSWPGVALNHQISRVFVADIVALICLIIGLAAYIRSMN
jgi:hypothetical protein